jgi:hypothetical protein
MRAHRGDVEAKIYVVAEGGTSITATGIGKAKMKESRQRFDKAEALCLHRSSQRRAVRQRHKQSTDQTAGGVDLSSVGPRSGCFFVYRTSQQGDGHAAERKE